MNPKARRNWILIVITLMFIVGIRAGTSRAIAPTPYFSHEQPMVIAHQGGDGIRPGNTMVAFAHAMTLGVDVLEMDVHATQDGELVLIHDATVERTTNGQGSVAQKTFDELQTLDAAYHWPYEGEARPYRGKGVKIPRLVEVLKRFPQAHYNIEIKQDGPELARALCELLLGTAAAERALVASFMRAPILEMRRACPDVATSSYRLEVMWFMAYYKLGLARIYHPAGHALQLPPKNGLLNYADAGLFEAAAKRGMHVDLWTINDAQTMRSLLKKGVHGIITDYPDRLLAARASLEPRSN